MSKTLKFVTYSYVIQIILVLVCWNPLDKTHIENSILLRETTQNSWEPRERTPYISLQKKKRFMKLIGLRLPWILRSICNSSFCSCSICFRTGRIAARIYLKHVVFSASDFSTTTRFGPLVRRHALQLQFPLQNGHFSETSASVKRGYLYQHTPNLYWPCLVPGCRKQKWSMLQHGRQIDISYSIPSLNTRSTVSLGITVGAKHNTIFIISLTLMTHSALSNPILLFLCSLPFAL